MTIGQTKVMNRADAFINNEKVVHVFNPSRLGGPTTNLEDKILDCYVWEGTFEVLGLTRCNPSLMPFWNNECQHGFWPCF